MPLFSSCCPTASPTTGPPWAPHPSSTSTSASCARSGRKLDPKLRESDIPKLRRQAEAVCAAGCPPFDPRDAPALTRDPEDDPIVYTALLANCDLLISDDSDIVPDRESEVYEHGGSSVLAVTFNRMMHAHIPTDDVDFDAIDGSWLAVAF